MICEERGLWREGSDELVAVQVPAANGRRAKQQFKRVVTKRMTLDEAKAVLMQQPDFRDQQNWLTETVAQLGHVLIVGPKFHPEIAVVEYFWGDCKRYTRARCDYSIDGLLKTVPEALQHASRDLGTIRRTYEHVFRYMRAYRMGTLNCAEVEWCMRKYTSHRRSHKMQLQVSDADLDVAFLSGDFLADMPKELKDVVYLSATD